ncbi:MAG: DEAD/DEAH box helicase [Veillonellaceae bacterium]|nr:DEAD/DEAH box helicase [Veillonellaceae bacterium]
MSEDGQQEVCILDVREDRLCLFMHLPDGGARLLQRSFMRTRLRPAQSADSLDVPGVLRFRRDLPYQKWREIDEIFARKIPREGYRYETTQAFRNALVDRDIHIQERRRLGLDIKRHDSRLREKFGEFSSVVNQRMERRLRDRQMWDAFFMTLMKKSGNFSVPGSGKTSSVYGMFAFLQARQGMKRIVMIGPKNAFGSWIDEFQACFGEKQALHLFDIHDIMFTEEQQHRRLLRYQQAKYNLMLFNYEIARKWKDILIGIVDDPQTMLVFDEVHRVKAVRGERARVALDIAEHAHYVTVMTGTPVPNGYVDLYNMIHILFPREWRDFFDYTPGELKDPPGPVKADINESLKSFYCRTTKEQLHVPPASPDLLKRVDAGEAENRLFYILKEAYGKRNMLAYMIRVLQLESVPQQLLQKIDLSELKYVMDVDAVNLDDIDLKDFSKEVPELVRACGRAGSKLKLGARQVQKLVGEGKLVICWCCFKATIRELRKMLHRQGIGAEYIDGSLPADMRQDVLDRFRSREFPVLITNPQTLAESVSLHSVCHDAVYIEYSYNLVHLLQSKDRIHRLGLPEGQYTQYRYLMEYYDFQGQEVSFDKAIYDRLQDKEQLMLGAIDDEMLEETTSSEEDLRIIFDEVFGAGGGRRDEEGA